MIIEVNVVVPVIMDVMGIEVVANARERSKAGPRVTVMDGFESAEETITNAYELPLVGKSTSNVPDDEAVL